MEKYIKPFKDTVLKHKDIFLIAGLFILCILFYFTGLGNYRLIDIDETRYINIARTMFDNKDYITPILNFEPFLEKPPLYYWLIVLSYKIFNTTNEFASRFPTAFMATAGVFATYGFVLYVVKSRLCAFLCASVLMSAFWYTLFAHIAILDIGFTVLTMCAIYSGVSTLFVENEKIKKLLWYAGYLFIGLSVLQKGLIGIIIPSMVVFLTFLLYRRAKEIFKPSYIIPGLIIFLIVSAPWHYLVYKANGEIWFREYIIKHHFARFIDSSMGIRRKRGFLYYIPILLGGLLPWSVFFIASAIKGLKNAAKKTGFLALSLNKREDSLIVFSIIYFVSVFVFFSISSTKLPTYIITVLPPVSIIIGYFWYTYIKENKNFGYIKKSSVITLLIFMLSGLFGIFYYFLGYINVGINLALSFFILPFIGFYFLYKNNRGGLFSVFVLLSLSLCLVCPPLFNFATSFGQDEIEEYAKIAAGEKNKNEFILYDCSKKYSVLNEYNKQPVHFINGQTKEQKTYFYTTVKNALKDNKTIYLVIKNKKKYSKDTFKVFKRIKKGEKYTLYKYEPR